MKRKWLTLLLSVFLFIFTFDTCQDDNLYDLVNRIYVYLTVVSTSPAQSSVNVASNASISIEFSQAVDSSTFIGSLTIDSIMGQVDLSQYNTSWSADKTTVTLTPTATSEPYPLQLTIYTLSINNAGIRSVDGNPMETTYSSSFTSLGLADKIPPSLSSHCVISGVGCISSSGIINPVDGVRFSFSEPMLPTSVSNALSFSVDTGSEIRTITPTSTTWTNNNQDVDFTFTSVPAGTATLTLSNGAVDASGNPLNNPISETFIVGSSNIVDYTVTGVNHPLGGTTSAAIAGSFALSNVGTINGSSNVNWSVYRSSDANYDAGDTLVISGSQGALAGGSSITVPYSGTWPGSAGTYYLIVVLSGGGDGFASNNSNVSSAIQVIAPAPDYVVSSSSFASSGTTGLSVSGSFVITNIGTVNGGVGVNWKLYTSTDASYDAGDTQIASGSQLQLNAGISSTAVPLSGTWPATAGTYYLIITLSATDDGLPVNNTKVSSVISVGVPTSPDYTIITPAFPASGINGAAYSGSFVVHNVGGANGSNIIQWNVYRSADAVYDVGDTLIDTGFYPPLTAGTSSSTINFNSIWPAVASYYLIIKATATDDASTTNNETVSSAIAVTPGGDTIAPTVGNTGTITAASVTPSTLTLNWTAGTDDVTTPANLTYTVYQSTSASATTTGSIITGPTANISTFNVTGLSASTTYYFNVVITDQAANTSNYTEVLQATTTLGTVAAPAQAGGSVPGTYIGKPPLSINLSTGTVGSTIWYKTDGNAPTCGTGTSGTAGTSFATVTLSTKGTYNLKAIACKTSYTDSTVTTVGTYTLSHVFITTWGTSGTANGQFVSPVGVKVDSAGNVYVADSGNQRIQKFTSAGTFIGWIADGLSGWQTGASSGTGGPANGQFNNPSGVAVDSSGYIYVTDFFNYRIQKFTSAGTFIGWLGDGLSGWQTGASSGTGGPANGQFNLTWGIAVDSSGNVYVADIGNYRIQKFTSAGTFIGWLGDGLSGWQTGASSGTGGSANGQFSSANGVAVDFAGNIYVADRGNNRIQKFDFTGAISTTWGTNGPANGQFSNPSGVAVDSSGNVYVADRSNHRIQVFTSAGTFITTWGTFGPANGQFNNPFGIAVDSAGNVYVADNNNNRIQKFGP